jgi:multidrug resistance protein MdtO
VSREGRVSALDWEDRLLRFLRLELAPTPGRARATARIVASCLIATAFAMTCHSPHASVLIITIFVLNQANAGASLTKAMWRVMGTLVGAGLGLVCYVAFLDHPWLRVALMGPIAAFFIFLSQTSTAPYFGLLGGITAVMIITVPGPDAEAGLHMALWRFAMIALGTVLASAAQLYLWPDDPEEQLYDALDERLAAVEEILAIAREGRQAETRLLDSTMLTGLARQLDLLDNAEARYASLRHRHAEQVSLIGGIEKLLTASVSFVRATNMRKVAPGEAAKARLSAIITDCGRLRDALQYRRPVGALPDKSALPSDAEVAATGDAAMLPGLIDMEGAIYTLPGVTGCLERRRAGIANAPSLALLDSPARQPFFTPSFSLANVDAIVFSVRVGLTATVAHVLYEGMAWPGLSTSVWTALLISQSTLGASVQKSILRLAGAILGGVLGFFTIVLLMPNMDHLAPLLVTVAICSAIAGWFSTGSARISYVGIQIGLAFALCVLNDLGPTTDLAPPRDRVMGILLGIGVWAFVFGLTGTVIAGAAMRRSLAGTLRGLAGLARVGLHGDPTLASVAPSRGWRWTVYQHLTTTLRLHDESKFEWSTRGDAEADRARIAQLVADAQSVFLALLALLHHRLSGNLAAMPPALHTELQQLANAVVLRLEALANRVQGRAEAESPALDPLLARARAVAHELEPSLNDLLRTHVPGRIALYHSLVARIDQLDRDAIPLGDGEAVRLHAGAAVQGA